MEQQRGVEFRRRRECVTYNNVLQQNSLRRSNHGDRNNAQESLFGKDLSVHNCLAPWNHFGRCLIPIIIVISMLMSFYCNFWSKSPSLLTNTASVMVQSSRLRPATGSVHVIVVGGGLAGISAALEAATEGARVTLLEKEASLGGNSAKATSGINGVQTEAQWAAGIHDDTVSRFVQDVLVSGRPDRLRAQQSRVYEPTANSVPSLAHTLGARSAKAVEFLQTNLGSPLSHVVPLGGHSVPRTHRLPPSPDGSPLPIGFLTISALKRALEKANITVLLNTRVLDLALDVTAVPYNVQGVKVTQVDSKLNASFSNFSDDGPEVTLMEADAVVLTTGGFAADVEPGGLVARWLPEVPTQLPFTTNGKFATGDMLKVAFRYKLQTVGLEDIQLHPTSFVDPAAPSRKEKFLCPEAIRGFGAILLDSRGERFVNELQHRDVVTKAILAHGQPASAWHLPHRSSSDEGPEPITVLLLMNEVIRERLSPPVFDFYKKRGFIRELGDLSNAVRILQLSRLVDTLTEYAATAEDTISGKESRDPLGRHHFGTVFRPTDTYFAAFVTPASHYTMGGIRINPETQVIPEGLPSVPVTNLFAAGEVAGGVHGKNRLGGNGMLESVVYGRIAGYNAARVASIKHIQKNLVNASVEKPLPLSVREIEPILDSNTSVSSPFFWRLVLSLPSLGQVSGLPLNAARLSYSISVTERRHQLQDGELRDTFLVETPVSTIGYIAALLPPTGPSSLLKHLHPGDTLLVHPTNSGAIKSPSMALYFNQELGILELAVETNSTSINVAARLGYGEITPREKIKIHLVVDGNSPVDPSSLVSYLNALGLKAVAMTYESFKHFKERKGTISPISLLDIKQALEAHCSSSSCTNI